MIRYAKVFIINLMVYCVYLNPTIDKTVYCKRFVFGGTNRPHKVIVEGAGKAVNVAAALALMGVPVRVAGFVCSGGADAIRNKLERCGVQYTFRELDGYARVNTKIFDGETQTVTEINEQGPEVGEEDLAWLEGYLLEHAGADDTAVLTGSMPRGVPESCYAQLIEKLNEKGVRCVLDAGGEALRLGAEQGPYMIQPNLDELEAAYGHAKHSLDVLRDICDGIIRLGVQVVTVTLGAEGVVVFGKEGAYTAQAPEVEVLSTVGAGDALAAGMVAQIGRPLDEMLRHGVAAATAAVASEGTGLGDQELYIKYLDQVKIKDFK